MSLVKTLCQMLVSVKISCNSSYLTYMGLGVIPLNDSKTNVETPGIVGGVR